MAETILTNVALIAGTYGAETIDFFSSEAETTILSGLTATKTADRELWINGPLTYTITVTNALGEDLTNGTITDTLDALITFNTAYGVRVNDIALDPADYSFSGGVLTVNLPTIEDGASIAVTFQVLQV